MGRLYAVKKVMVKMLPCAKVALEETGGFQNKKMLRRPCHTNDAA